MQTWKSIQNPKRYAIYLAISFFLLYIATNIVTVQYLKQFETRNGFVPYDPFMILLPSMDVSWMVFFCLYISVAVSYFYFFQNPYQLLLINISFVYMYFIRSTCITLVPFNEPVGLIPLTDPLIDALGLYADTGFIRRDLFFSGHFASVFMPYLILKKERPLVGWLLLLACVGVGLGIMLQHIHYSYDIIGALCFGYVAVCLAQKTLQILIDKWQF